jgi:DNA-binding NarL/FixJ family response regulator
VSPVPELSDVEEQIVLLIARGRSYRSIADELGISLKTVEWHVARARRKLARAATLHDQVQRLQTAPGREEEVR